MISSRTLVIILIVNMAIALGSVVLNYRAVSAINAITPATAVNTNARGANSSGANSSDTDVSDATSATATDPEASAGEASTAAASNGVRPSRSFKDFFGGADKPKDFDFYTVEKIIIGVPGEEKQHYFILDLVLQAEPGADKKRINNVLPAVRSAVVSYLSDKTYDGIRYRPFHVLQAELEAAILRDFSHKNIAVPFEHVLVSKLIAQ